jgi:hypothetical protein
MKRKIIYLIFLVIGSNILISISSCESDVDYIINTHYYYVNKSQHNIEMKVFNSIKELIKTYEIPSSDTLMYIISAEGGAGPFQFESDIREIGDSIYVTFAGSRYLSFTRSDNILRGKFYTEIKISKYEYDMYYFFTDNDYENAKEIE